MKKNKYFYVGIVTVCLGFIFLNHNNDVIRGEELPVNQDQKAEESSSPVSSVIINESEQLQSTEPNDLENQDLTKITPFADNDYLEYSTNNNLNYDESSSTEMFRDLDIPETATNTKIVSTEPELRAAVLDLAINYIYMDEDIQFSNTGIKIPYEKKYMRLSGKDPVTGKNHTLKERVIASNSSSNLYVTNNTSQNEPRSYGIENMIIDGYNNYGPINVNDSSYYVHISMADVVYDGTQPNHNLNGTNEFYNWEGTIPYRKNGYEGQELAEAHFINVYGDFKLYHNGAHSIAWFGYGSNVRNHVGRFAFKKGSNADIQSVGRSFFYFDNVDAELVVEEGANVNIVTGGGIVRETNTRALSLLDVGKNATLKIERTSSSNAADNRLPTIKLRGDINVAEGGRLYLNNESDTGGAADEFIRFYNDGSHVNIDKAKSVLFYNPKGKILSAYTNNHSGYFDGDIQSMNLWKTVPSDKFVLTPDNHFSFPDFSNISFESQVKRIAANNHATTIISANPVDITPLALDFNNLKVISMGITPEITVEEITDAAETITGTGTVDGTAVATYDDGEGKKQLTAIVDSKGNYEITIPERASGGKYIKPYTKVQMEIFYDYRTAPIIYTEVIDVSAPSGDPVRTIIDKDTAISDFPEAKDMVTNLWDKSLETIHPKLTVAYSNSDKPDLGIIGPVQPLFEVKVTDEANNSANIKVPIFIKDQDTAIAQDKAHALRAVDVTVRTMEYPKTNSELASFIIKESELKGWEIDSGLELDVSSITMDQGTVPQPDSLTSTVPIGEHKVTFSYGTGDSTVSKSILLKIIPSTAKLVIRFVDEDDVEINGNVERVLDIGSKINLTEDSEVEDIIKLLEKNKYKLINRPTGEAEIEIMETGTTVSYHFVGTLQLISAPTDVDFGTVSIIDFQKKVGVDKSNIATALIVEDTRKAKEKWEITAQIEKEMTNGEDVQVGALKYVANKVEKTLNGNAQTIYANDGSSGQGKYNISDSWGKADLEEGLKLQIESDRVPNTSGSYEGIIRWTLRDTIE